MLKIMDSVALRACNNSPELSRHSLNEGLCSEHSTTVRPAYVNKKIATRSIISFELEPHLSRDRFLDLIFQILWLA